MTGRPSSVPFSADVAQAEASWLLAREIDPGAPAPSPQIAADYAELEELLGSLPSGPCDASWHDDVLRAVSDHGAAPCRSDGAMHEFMEAARTANARITMHPAIDVH